MEEVSFGGDHTSSLTNSHAVVQCVLGYANNSICGIAKVVQSIFLSLTSLVNPFVVAEKRRNIIGMLYYESAPRDCQSCKSEKWGDVSYT